MRRGTWLLALAAIAAASGNRFAPDDVLAVRIYKNHSCGPERCVQQVGLARIAAPFGRGTELPILPCTLPPWESSGLGQLSLSGDGRAVSLACTAHPAGTDASTVTEWVMALVSSDLAVDISTRLTLPAGKLVYSAVSDGGSGVWAGSDLGLHFLSRGSTQGSVLLMLPANLSPPVRHVTIVNDTLVCSIGQHVVLFGSLPRSPSAAAGGKIIFSTAAPRGAFGHTFSLLPRSGPVYLGADRFTNSTSPLLPARPYGFIFREAFDGVNADVFVFVESDGGSWQRATSGGAVVASNTAVDTLSGVASVTRWANLNISFFEELAHGYRREAFANVITSSDFGTFNTTLFSPDDDRGPYDMTNNAFAYEQNWQTLTEPLFAGVALAPVDARLPVPVPIPSPSLSEPVSPSSTPVASASPTQLATASASPLPWYASATPSSFPPIKGDLGLLVGQRIGRDFFPSVTSVLLLRLGSINASSPSADYRDTLIGRRPQPYFIDVLRLDGPTAPTANFSSLLLATLPITSKRSGVHRACTAPFRSPRMWSKLQPSVQSEFATMWCYDVPVDQKDAIIPDSLYPYPANESGASSPWVHSDRVVASIFGGGAIDTRTTLNAACRSSFVTGAQLADRQLGFMFYVSNMPFPDAGPEAYNKCGVLLVPLASAPEQGISLLEPNRDDITQIATLQGSTYGMASNPSLKSIMRFGLDYGIVAKPGFRTFQFQARLNRIPSLVRMRVPTTTSVLEFMGDRPVTSAYLLLEAPRDRQILVTTLDFNTRAYKQLSVFGCPDNRTIIDMFPAPSDLDMFFTSPLGVGRVYVRELFAVTADTSDGNNWKAGSALWRITLPDSRHPSSFQKLVELPCCKAIWTSGMLNDRFGVLQPSPTPSQTPSHTATYSARPSVNRQQAQVVAQEVGPVIVLSERANALFPSTSVASFAQISFAPGPRYRLVSPACDGVSATGSALVVSEGGFPSSAIVVQLSASFKTASLSSSSSSYLPLFKEVFSAIARRNDLFCWPSDSRLLVSSAFFDVNQPLQVNASTGAVVGTFVVNVTASLDARPGRLSPQAAWKEEGLSTIVCDLSTPQLVTAVGRRLPEALGNPGYANVRLVPPLPVRIWEGLWPLIGSLSFVPPAASAGASRDLRCNVGATNSTAAQQTHFCNASLAVANQLVTSSLLIRTSASTSTSLVSLASAGVSIEPESVMTVGAHDKEGGFLPFLSSGGGPGLRIHFAGILIREAVVDPIAGQWLAFVLPPYEDVCPGSLRQEATATPSGGLPQSGKGCKEPRLVLSIPADDPGGRASRKEAQSEICASDQAAGGMDSAAAASSLMKRRPGTLSCPPSCSTSDLLDAKFLSASASSPQSSLRRRELQASSTASPLSAFDWLFGNASLGGVVDSESAYAARALQPLPSGAAASGAVRFSYAKACIPRSSYPPGVSSLASICGNATDPRSQGNQGLCYYGQQPNDCLLCPAGGLCPSGYKLWSRPGWWVETEDQAELPVPCQYPSERCAGWDFSAGTTGCGKGYAGKQCLLCEPGFYRSTSTGACAACPANSAISTLAASFLPFVIVGAYTALVGLVFAAVCIYITTKHGGTVTSGLARGFSFGVSTWISLNLVSTVARSAPSLTNDPSSSAVFLSSVFAALRAIQGGEGGDIGPVPLACTTVSPLLSPKVLMITSLVLEFLWLVGACVWVWDRLRRRSIAGIAGKCAAILTSPAALFLYRCCAVAAALLFSVTTNAALSVTSCKPLVVSLEQYDWLRGDGTAAAAALGKPSSELQRVLQDRTDTALLSRTFTVSVMVSQPEVVCGEGEHIAAQRLAIATVVLFSLGFPLLSLLVVRFLAIPTVLRTTRIPEALWRTHLSHVSFGGSKVSSILAPLAGSLAGKEAGKKEGLSNPEKLVEKAPLRQRIHQLKALTCWRRFSGPAAVAEASFDESRLAQHLLIKPAAASSSAGSTEWRAATVLGLLDQKRRALSRRATNRRLTALFCAHERYVPSSSSSSLAKGSSAPIDQLVFRYPESLRLAGGTKASSYEVVTEDKEEGGASEDSLTKAFLPRDDEGWVTVAPVSLDSCGPLRVLFCCCCCRAGACTRSYRLIAQTRDDLIDSSLGLHISLLSQPVVFFVSGGTYRPSKFYALQLDWLLMVFVQVVNVAAPNGYSSVSALRARGAFIFLLSLALAAWNGRVLPDTLARAQQLPLRIVILILSAFAALYSAAGAAAATTEGESLSASESGGVLFLGYVVILLCLSLPLVILWAFVSMLITTAKAEGRDKELGSRAFQAAFEKAKTFYAEIQRRRQAAVAETAARAAKAATERILVSPIPIAIATKAETPQLHVGVGELAVRNPILLRAAGAGAIDGSSSSSNPAATLGETARIYVVANPTVCERNDSLSPGDERDVGESPEDNDDDDAFAGVNPLRAGRR